MNSKKTSTNKLLRMINFYTISHDTGIASKLRSKSSNNGKKRIPGGRLYNELSWQLSNDDNEVLTINSGPYPETFPYHFDS